MNANEGCDDCHMNIEYRREVLQTPRLSEKHVTYVDFFLAYAFGREDSVLCPCRNCVNRERVEVRDDVRLHLLKYGFDPTYVVWTFHGEAMSHEEVNDSNVGKEKSKGEVFFDNVVRDFRDEPEILASLLGEKNNPLYRGCKKDDTVISCLIELFNMKASSGWSEVSVNRLLGFLHNILPEGNNLPSTLYEAKKILCPFEMEYEKIHACPNGCILYRDIALKTEVICPICKASRYKPLKIRKGVDVMIDNDNQVPAKCVWYLPIIPRIERLFGNVEDAKHLTWHSDRNVPDDDVIRHPADGDQWRKINELYPKFGDGDRNLRFALSTDGMNPFRSLSSKHSSWPVMLIIYNLPPYLCMKRKYVMMPLLISGPKQPGNEIDTYLAPLIEDLKILWTHGVSIFDAYRNEEFTLKAMLFCTISDFPARANLSGYVSKGHKACPICEEGTVFKQLKFGKKAVYMAHRRFLKRNHKYRRDKDGLFGGKECRCAPAILSGKEIHLKVNKLNVVLGKGKKKLSSQVEKSVWKKRSIFFDLPYWEDLDVHHCLDVMHIEKNVCDSLVGTLLNIPFKTKDTYNARKDMIDMGLRPDLAPEERGKRKYLPPGPCNLSKAEKQSVCDSLTSMKVPIGYSSNISQCVTSDQKMGGLKSHDCHVLMQQLLPVAIRGVLHDQVRYCITRLCFFFHQICRKSISRESLDKLEYEAVEILCELELYFPPAFFDIMVHLVVHLVREIRICGPVGMHWMYPFERHMGTFKGYVKCYSHPDASIVERYVTEEVIQYCTTHLEDGISFGVPKNKHAGRKDGVPRSKGSFHTPLFVEMKMVHHYILRNSKETVGYVEEHLDLLSELHSGMVAEEIQVEHNETFVDWFWSRCKDSKDKNLQAFARKPNCTVRRYTGYDINGYSFATWAKDAKSTTQSSGVYTDGETLFDTSKKGKNPTLQVVPFYGVIQEIWELDYVAFKCVVFKCKWVDVKSGIDSTDPLGFVRVDLKKVGSKNDEFILASQARQVFYVEDPQEPKWSIVLQGKKYFFDDEIDYQISSESIEFPPAFPQLSKKAKTVGIRRDHEDGLWVNERGKLIFEATTSKAVEEATSSKVVKKAT